MTGTPTPIRPTLPGPASALPPPIAMTHADRFGDPRRAAGRLLKQLAVAAGQQC
jgi:hypothetical protein